MIRNLLILLIIAGSNQLNAALNPKPYFAQQLGSNNEINRTVYDNAGNIYMVGILRANTNIKLNPFATAKLLNKDSGGFFLLKCDTSLNLKWIKVFGCANSLSNSAVRDMRLDQSGNIILGLINTIASDYDPDPSKKLILNLASGKSTSVLLKFSSNGNLIWGHTFGAGSVASVDGIHRLALDKSGSIYIVGSISEKSDFAPGSDTVWENGYGSNYLIGYLVKLDSNAKYKFHKTFSSPGKTFVSAVAWENNVITLGGTYTNTLRCSDDISKELYPCGTYNKNGFLAEYSSNGTLNRTAHINGGKGVAVNDILFAGGKMYLMLSTQDTLYFDLLAKAAFAGSLNSNYAAMYDAANWSFSGKSIYLGAMNTMYPIGKGCSYLKEQNTILFNVVTTTISVELNTLKYQSRVEFLGTNNISDVFAVRFNNTLLITGNIDGLLSIYDPINLDPPKIFASSNQTGFIMKFKMGDFLSIKNSIEPLIFGIYNNQNSFTVKLNSSHKLSKIAVYNTAGVLVTMIETKAKNFQEYSGEANVAFPEGIYVAVLLDSANNKIASQKVYIGD